MASPDDDAKSPSNPKYALIVGIDIYEHQGKIIPELSGCVADADDVDVFLKDTVHFPPENITCLRNKEATASKIVEALERLAKDPNIPKGSTIFIFFAGHGTEVEGPKGSHCRKIQMIVPYDFDPGSSTSKLPPRGDAETVDKVKVGDSIYHGGIAKNGLPDFKLNQLLKDIADNKGENITVIFDCCHSGSGTRGSRRADDDYTVARGIDLPHSTTIDIDTPPRSRALMVLDEDRNKGLASHVFLAACNENQLAYERRGRGAFTCALLSLLRSANLQQLTYLDIIKTFEFPPGKLSDQDPQCEGANKDHIFLHVNLVAERQNNSYNLRKNVAGYYVINAGEPDGVTVGDELTVYAPGAYNTDSELGCLTVYETTTTSSTLRPVGDGKSFDIPPDGTITVWTRRRQIVGLLIEPADSEVLANCIKDVHREMSPPSFEIVTSRQQEPDIIVSAKEDTAHFEISDRTCQAAGLSVIPSVVDINRDDWPSVLRGIANFFWNLKRTAAAAEPQLHRKVEVRCYELKEDGINYDTLTNLMTPTGDNLVQHQPDSDIIEIEFDESKRKYGFCIKNATSVPLFVSVFYFDMSDLSVTPYSQPLVATSKGPCASLPPTHGTSSPDTKDTSPPPTNDGLTIGYGDGGFAPQSYYIREGQNIDVGYLKLFISTTHVDYRHVTQSSPFQPKSRASESVPPVPLSLWDTIVIPIVQRRVNAQIVETCDCNQYL